MPEPAPSRSGGRSPTSTWRGGSCRPCSTAWRSPSGLIPVLAFAGLAGALSQGWDGAIAAGSRRGRGAVRHCILARALPPQVRRLHRAGFSRRAVRRQRGQAARRARGDPVLVPGARFGAVRAWASSPRASSPSISGLGMALAVAMLLLCSFAAGMRSASLTQIVQYAVLLAASLVTLALLAVAARSVASGARRHRPRQRRFAAFKLDSFAARTPPTALRCCSVWPTGIASLPHLLMRGLVTPSIEEARTSFLWASALCRGALPGRGALSLAVRRHAGRRRPIWRRSSLSASPPWARSRPVLAIGSGLALAIANALSYDVYYKSLHLTASTERRILVARAALVLVAGWQPGPRCRAGHHAGYDRSVASRLRQARFCPLFCSASGGSAPPARAHSRACWQALRCVSITCWRRATSRSPSTRRRASSRTPRPTRRRATRAEARLLPRRRGARGRRPWPPGRRRRAAVANWGGVKRDFAALFAVPIGFVVTIGVEPLHAGARRGTCRASSRICASRRSPDELGAYWASADWPRIATGARLVAEHAEGIAEALGVVARWRGSWAPAVTSM